MKSFKSFMPLKSFAAAAAAALALCAGSACRAEVPVIHLAPSTDDTVEQLDLAAQQQAAPDARPGAPGAAIGATSVDDVERDWQGAGSFALYAGGAFAALGSVGAVMPISARTHDGVLLARRPMPASGAVMLLVLGCLVYLGRRRHQAFALRPARNLLQRSAYAPAYI